MIWFVFLSVKKKNSLPIYALKRWSRRTPKPQNFHSKNTLTLISNSTYRTYGRGFRFNLWCTLFIVCSLTNLKENEELEICKVHKAASVGECTESFGLYPNLWSQFTKIKLVQNPQNPERWQQQYLKIYTHVCSHSSEMFRVIL